MTANWKWLILLVLIGAIVQMVLHQRSAGLSEGGRPDAPITQNQGPAGSAQK